VNKREKAGEGKFRTEDCRGLKREKFRAGFHTEITEARREKV